jgi:hypothetical protein
MPTALISLTSCWANQVDLIYSRQDHAQPSDGRDGPMLVEFLVDRAGIGFGEGTGIISARRATNKEETHNSEEIQDEQSSQICPPMLTHPG